MAAASLALLFTSYSDCTMPFKRLNNVFLVVLNGQGCNHQERRAVKIGTAN